MRYRISWDKGLNADVTPSELGQGFFSAGQNVAVRDGFATQSGVDIAITGGSAIVGLQWLGLAEFSGDTRFIHYKVSAGTATIQAATFSGTSFGALSNISPAAVTLPISGINITHRMFNGVYLINVGDTGLYYWTTAIANAVAVSGALVARYMCTFKYYIFQFGITDGADFFHQRVAWSNSAEPGSLPTSFTASSTNDAGEVELAETAGSVVDALPLGDALIIYKTDSRYAARYVGGNDVFRFDRLPGDDGILQNGCVVDTPVGHVFLSKNREVLLHQGGVCRNLSKGRINSLLERDISLVTGFRVIKNTLHSEVWVYNVNEAKFYIWNWINDTWGTHTPGLGTTGLVGRLTNGYSATIDEPLMLGATDTALYRLAVDPNRFSVYSAFTSQTSFVTRTGLDMGEPDVVKNLQGSRWNFDGAAGSTFSIEHGSAMTADGAPTYSSAATYTLGTTDYANTRATGGRYLATKCSWTTTTSTTETSRLRSADLDFTAGGKR
jgi:hypothetical protein